MDDDQHDLNWQLPRSLREARERWAHDAMLRYLVGALIAAAIVSILVIANLLRLTEWRLV